MVTITAVFRYVGAMALLMACGGDPFVFSSDAAAGGGSDASGTPQDAGREATLPVNGVLCTSNGRACSRALAETCCASVDPTHSSSCTSGSCNPCNVTQLACASDINCAFPAVCCISRQTDSTCSSSRFYAQCMVNCLTDDRLCDPRNVRCPLTKPMCSTNSSDLENLGLPSGQGYGVCK